QAGPYLYNYPFVLGDSEEDARTQLLVRRLLDSHIMTSCKGVFEAFDESLMFKDGSSASEGVSVQKTFKGVFQNISAVMDCISCQKCKLHGKVQLLGLGTALKILLLPEQLILPSLDRSEIVALFNTLAKFSRAIRAAPVLAAQYHAVQVLRESQCVCVRERER
ncbi:endoplasmic reticulum oxidoreductin 1, partial [Baffinella frigidus]